MSERRIAWRRVIRGLYLIGFGSLLFLNTQGIVPWSFWREALTFWPVGLIALGLRLAFERSRAPALTLLGPVLVIGTLAWVAMKAPGDRPADWETLVAERPGQVERVTLSLRTAMTTLSLDGRDLDGSLLAEGRVSPPGRRAMRVKSRGDQATVSLSRPRGTFRIGLLPGRTDSVELGLARDLPLALDFDVAFTDGAIDLATAPVSSVAIDGAFNDLTFRLGAPESSVRIFLDGAFNQIVLEVPHDTPVTTDTDGFLNGVDGRPGAGSLTGPGYHFSIDGAFNRLVVSSP